LPATCGRDAATSAEGITVSQHHVPPTELARTTTTATAATARTILALNLGKYKTVACLYQRTTAAYRFQTLDSSRDDLRKRFDRTHLAVVVFAAGASAGWVHDFRAERGRTARRPRMVGGKGVVAALSLR
jgi:hypothetical protein